MTTRHSIRCLAAAALLLAVPAASRADDLLDTVLRDDYPATAPATLQPLARPPASVQPSEPAPAPAPQPAPAPVQAAPSPIPHEPAVPDTAEPAFGGAGAADRTKPKSTFENQLMDAFAGCCFFVRPAPPKKRPADDEEPPSEEDFQ